MNTNRQFVFGIALTLLFSGMLFAQNDRTVSPVSELYVISAKAGGVSYVEGKVSVARVNGKSGMLLRNDQLEVGDKVVTGADSKAEIMLNPGSYLRLGSNSVFEFVTTNLDDLKIKLGSGSAVIEVLASDEFRVAVALPNANVNLTRSGVFRIDVLADGGGNVAVWKGKMFVNANTEIKSGRSVEVRGDRLAIEKFDRDGGDDLDLWSKLRAKEITAVNSRLDRGAMRNSLLSSYNNGMWNAFNSFGVWAFDPFRRMWSFLPFGVGWGSPYGFDYRLNMWYCDMPYYVYVYPRGGGSTNPTTNPNTVPTTSPTDRETRGPRPPFQRTDQSGNRVEPTRNGFPNPTSDDGSFDRNNRRKQNDNYDSPKYESPSVDRKPVFTPAPSTPIIVPPSRNPKNDKDN